MKNEENEKKVELITMEDIFLKNNKKLYFIVDNFCKIVLG